MRRATSNVRQVSNTATTEDVMNDENADVREGENDNPGCEEYELAGRGQRLAATMIDGLIGLFIGVPVYFFFLAKYVGTESGLPLMYILVSVVFGLAFFLLVHGYFLKENGQTVGKKVVGIRIADLYNDVPSLQTLILMRYLPIWIVTMIPLIGGMVSLVDVLFIFKDDRRCIHDIIAGTRVVVVE